MNVVAVVQARMSSSRLPGKVLADVNGAPMLARVIERARLATQVNAVWVACSASPADAPIAAWCRATGVGFVRGAENDVLSRFVTAADRSGADVIVRLTADCPLLDPSVIDLVVAAITSNPGTDYASNVTERSFPRGLDVEAFTRSALRRMDALGRSPEAREHVTIPARLEYPDRFVCRSIRSDSDDSDLRWTVDTPADLEFVRRAYQALGPAEPLPPYPVLVAWCRTNPQWANQDDGVTWDPSRSNPLSNERGRS